ncbi:hypothetical protein OIF81_10905 [Neisseria meningitidis]|uniref:hypothetical protein n=1 Tax=Neisseria meningitidis TaxID=487 RepID=UPI0021F16064|nr:hypothetical protein [Neisseria meningitidis]MCV6696586.1 hypothetical protein [Neisseria meningitidis]
MGIQFFEFQSFPINCLSIECLDSRLRGNDGGAVSVFSGKYPQAKIPLFSQKQKTKNRNLKFVIHTNLHPVIPTKVGIQFFEFQSFPINCLSIECLDSRLRGNDGGAVSIFSGKYPQAKILLFSQKQKTKNRNLKFVIPAQAGIWFVRFRLF